MNEGSPIFRHQLSTFAPRSKVNSRVGFTLVELLVVIAIIAILAALLVVGAQAAIRSANQARITATMNQLNNAFEQYTTTAYPPNTQTGQIGGDNLINQTSVLSAFKRFLKKQFPQHREPEALLSAIVGLGNGSGAGQRLEGGMNAAEAVVFWMGGFSDDPKYPISGPGGPSYPGTNFADDPIENRSWALDVNVQNLGPRNSENFFDQTDQRYVIYNDPRNPGQQRRINFWYLKAPGSPAPYLYFDASRATSAESDNDAAAVTTSNNFTQFTGADADTLNQLLGVHAVKSRKSNASDQKPFQFANFGKFQLLHCGIDEDWGIFPRVSPNPPGTPTEQGWLIGPSGNLEIFAPNGPWTLELADTLSNFADGTLEDAQP